MEESGGLLEKKDIALTGFVYVILWFYEKFTKKNIICTKISPSILWNFDNFDNNLLPSVWSLFALFYIFTVNESCVLAQPVMGGWWSLLSQNVIAVTNKAQLLTRLVFTRKPFNTNKTRQTGQASRQHRQWQSDNVWLASYVCPEWPLSRDKTRAEY